MSQSNVIVPAPSTTFRDLATNPPPAGICPTFLLGPVGQKYMYTCSVLYDALADGAGYAVRARFPQYAPEDALQWLAADRQIVRGPNESASHYVPRLIQWLDLWRHAGENLAIMLAVLGAVSPATPQVRMVQTSGETSVLWTRSQWDTYAAGADPFPPGQTDPTPPYRQYEQTSPPVGPHLGNWYWDSALDPFYAPWMRWRAWLIVYSLSGSPWAAPTATWGGGAKWGDGTCWGWAGTNADAVTLTEVVRQWKSAHCWVPWILITYDVTMFDPTQTFGSSKLPDGTWGHWGKVVSDPTYGSVYVAARPSASTVSFLDGAL